MRAYIARRFLYMLLMMIMASVVSFAVITLPPGDYMTSYIMRLKAQGQDVGLEEELALRRQYGLDQPLPVQYFKWVSRFIKGDMGRSFEYNRPVVEVLMPRLGMTMVVSVAALIVTYLIAIPIGIYSALHQYSIPDYIFSIIAFIGVSMPNFLLALILMVFAYRTFGISIGGLFSLQFVDAPWSWAKFVDLLRHLPIPLAVIGLSGTAWLMRTMRATLLDEIHKPYVQTARAKGLKEGQVLRRYPIRVALNPIASTIGWQLPNIFSGQTIVSIVLDLPTIGPVLLRALMTEDMFLAASTVMITTALTLVGTLLSDLLLGWLDPRIQVG
ncbi:MAG: ABC transporter permease [Anaerolineae bacterium]|jgi:peptide/nickel transport system permease protein|nr:ABC transporter permease [Chloroflexota bacterium]